MTAELTETMTPFIPSIHLDNVTEAEDGVPKAAVTPQAGAPSCNGLAGIDLLLRDPGKFIDTLNATEDPLPAVRTLLVTTIFGAIAFGAAIGTYRGGRQIAFSGLKLPMVEILTAAICAPMLTALNSAVHGRASMRRDFALILVALTFGTMLAAGLSPTLLLANSWGLEYHRTILLLVAICLVSGAWGLSVFLSGLRGDDLRGRAIVGSIIVTAIVIVGAQTSWVLRPYILRPTATSVPLFRSVDDDFLTSVVTDVDSSRGYYTRITGTRGTR